MRKEKPNHLAYHETLEIHELVAFQATGLVKLKKGMKEITDDALKNLYQEAIQSLEKNIIELLSFFPAAPTERSSEERNDLLPFYAGDLLGFAKTSVRNYAIAITETATPSLRSVLVKQLNATITLHAKVFEFMYDRSYYPAYNLQELLEGDVELAQKAINMRS